MMDVVECIGTKFSNAFEGDREGWAVISATEEGTVPQGVFFCPKSSGSCE